MKELHAFHSTENLHAGISRKYVKKKNSMSIFNEINYIFQIYVHTYMFFVPDSTLVDKKELRKEAAIY